MVGNRVRPEISKNGTPKIGLKSGNRVLFIYSSSPKKRKGKMSAVDANGSYSHVHEDRYSVHEGDIIIDRCSCCIMKNS